MHPEIRQMGPGSCPICGMALEPVADENPGAVSEEETDLRRRLVWGTLLGAPILFLSMLDMFGWMRFEFLHSSSWGWIQVAASTLVVFWSGWPLLKKGLASFINFHLNMFSLIFVGTISAYLWSVILWMQNAPAHELYFESGIGITLLVLAGQLLESRSRAKSRKAVRALLQEQPKTARKVFPDGHEEEMHIGHIAVGDFLRVRPGERVPADGMIFQGSSQLDESTLTGEPMPKEKKAGERVLTGSLNGDGSFVLCVEKIGSETLLAQMAALVEKAQLEKAPIQKLVDRVSAIFVPAVFFLALITFLAWALLANDPTRGATCAIAVLLIACPCALGLATPLSLVIATARAASQGILVRDLEAYETLSKINFIALDKTGTLTRGKPTLLQVETLSKLSSDEILELAACLENGSLHPLGRAILESANAKGIASKFPESFFPISGKGLVGEIRGKKTLLGNELLMQSFGISLPANTQNLERLRKQGNTILFLAVDQELKGWLQIADPIKEEAKATVDELRRMQVELLILSGDHSDTVEFIAKELGIQRYEGKLLPAQKLEKIRDLQSQGFSVAMAGDGNNDAPALAQADLGIAMGTGTDVAIDTAGIILVRGKLDGIARAVEISRATLKNVRQNLILAFGYNVLTIPVATGIFYPIFGWLLSPMIAAAAMGLSSVSVIWNSLRVSQRRGN